MLQLHGNTGHTNPTNMAAMMKGCRVLEKTPFLVRSLSISSARLAELAAKPPIQVAATSTVAVEAVIYILSSAPSSPMLQGSF